MKGFWFVKQQLNTQHITDATIISNLNDIPVGTKGRVKLASALRPNSNASLYNYECYGEGNTRTLIVSSEYYGLIWANYKNGSTWSGWNRFANFASDVQWLPHVVASGYLQGNSSVTFTPTAELTLFIAQYGSSCAMYSILSASSTNAPVAEIRSVSGISLTTSNGVVTVANSTTSSFRYRFMAIYPIA